MSTELYPPLGPSPDPYWATVTDWYIDPAQTHGGNDRNTGATGKPIASIAEWRRRVAGAVFDSPVTIHVLSSSTADDDGTFTGFRTVGNGAVCLMATPTVIFSGTVTGYAAYAGNARGTLTDAAIPVSWTASGGISTLAVGGRFIRKTGTYKQAALLKDLGANTVMIGLPTTISEVSTSFPSNTITDFATGEAYEVVSQLRWPRMQTEDSMHVRYFFLDVEGGTNPSGLSFDQHFRCTFLSTLTPYRGNAFACLGLAAVAPRASYTITASAFAGVTVQYGNEGSNMNSQENVFVNATINIWHCGLWGSSGTLRCFDNTTVCLSVRHVSQVNLQSLVGDGNTGKLIQAEGGSQVYGGATATAATTDANPFQVSGVSYAAPTVDAVTGDGVYA